MGLLCHFPRPATFHGVDPARCHSRRESLVITVWGAQNSSRQLSPSSDDRPDVPAVRAALLDHITPLRRPWVAQLRPVEGDVLRLPLGARVSRCRNPRLAGRSTSLQHWPVGRQTKEGSGAQSLTTKPWAMTQAAN